MQLETGNDPSPAICRLPAALPLLREVSQDDSGADIPLCDESFSIYTPE